MVKLAQQMRRVGRVCFGLMWVPFITLFIGMIGMPDGSYAFDQLPMLTRVSIVAGGVLMFGSVILQVGAPIVSGVANQSLLQHGRLAEATILQISDTGMRINNNPVVRLLLEVRPPGEPPFQSEAERLVSQLEIPQIQPGAMVNVRYDPASKAVALASGDSASLI